MAFSWQLMSSQLQAPAAANTLGKLSDQEIENLAKPLGRQVPPLWETLFIKLSELPEFNQKLDGRLLSKIKNNYPKLPVAAAKAFLDLIRTWPEMTLEKVAQGLDDADDNAIASIVRAHISPARESSQAAPQIVNPGIENEADLLLAYGTSVEEQLALEQLMRQNAAAPVPAAAVQYRDPFGDDLPAFFDARPEIRSRVVEVLAGFDNEQSVQDAADRRNNLVNSHIRELLNSNPALMVEIVHALDGRNGNNWLGMIRFLSQQAPLLGKFQPDPESWCEGITDNYVTNPEKCKAILDTLCEYQDITVGALVTAIAAAGRCFEPLCKRICREAGAPGFASKLEYGLNEEPASRLTM